ncbi:MAG: IclR family transcriptional regulator [Acidobacteriaceae bacterium]
MEVARKTADPYAVEAVLSALDILDAFEGSQELSLHEISRRTSLNKSRCFRLLHTLASRKYVERTAAGQAYRLSSRLLDQRVDTRDIRKVAHPYLICLRDQFNGTVNLGLVHNGEIFYVDLVESQRAFWVSAIIGSRMPIATTAMGKAMLAALSKKAVATLLAGQQVPRNLRGGLERVRQSGHAIDNEDNEPGVACIGACILDGDGMPAAAIGVSGPVHRILIREQEIAAALRQVCRRASEQLGFDAGVLVAGKGVSGLG